MSREVAAVRARHERWVEVVNERPLSGYAELLTPDAVWVPPVGEAMRGREAVTAWLRPFFERYEYDFTLTDPHWRTAGGWVVERGRFRTRLRAARTEDPWSPRCQRPWRGLAPAGVDEA